MGFFDGLREGLSGRTKRRSVSKNRDVLDAYHDMDELDSDYRSTAFKNSKSNAGWYTCARCGKKFRRSDIDVDHILPRSKGGDNSRYNLQLLCPHCNRSKRDDTTQTAADLKRRRKELKRQDKEDLEFLDKLSKRRK